MRNFVIALVGLEIVRCDTFADLSSDMSAACPHQYSQSVSPWENITTTGFVSKDISANHSHLFYFENYKYINSDRKIVFRLEPCAGIQYLFIRRTRPCWPDPHTGEWAHYMSVTDGSEDAQPTLIEVPASSTQWFITVFAKSSGRYSLTVVEYAETYPRIPDGAISSSQLTKETVELTWQPATVGNSRVERYIIYSSMVFESVTSAPAASRRIFNTVCGLKQNTDHPYSVVSCSEDTCRANISSLVNDRKYFFNVMADTGSMQSAFNGIQVRTLWDTSVADAVRQAAVTASIVIGTVTCVLVAAWFTLYKLYM